MYQAASKSNIRELVKSKTAARNLPNDFLGSTLTPVLQRLETSTSTINNGESRERFGEHAGEDNALEHANSNENTESEGELPSHVSSLEEDVLGNMSNLIPETTDAYTTLEPSPTNIHGRVSSSSEGSTTEAVSRFQDSNTKPRAALSRRFQRPSLGTHRVLSLIRNRRAKTPGEIRSEQVEEQLRKMNAREDNESKILLLGASLSGKSTLFKSMKLLFEGGYAKDEKAVYKDIISANITLSVREVLRATDKMELSLDQTLSSHAQMFLEQPDTGFAHATYLSKDIGWAVELFWADNGFQHCYRRSREYQLDDNFAYYCQNIRRIAHKDYIPTQEDILRSRIKSTGITETRFFLNAGKFWRAYDVGGARSERKKWIHVFDNVDTIFFTVDITSFDKVLIENEDVNRMQEELTLFDSIVNSLWFQNTKVILLFTKVACLSSQLRENWLRTYFPDFEGENTFEDVVQYITERFRELKWRNDFCLEIRYVDLQHGPTSMARAALDAWKGKENTR